MIENERTDNGAATPAVPAVQSRGIVKPAGDIGQAVSAYREVQQALDKAMPDCIQTIAGKPFRKKNYWRGVATAFSLDVTLVSEQRVEEGKDWGWLVVYRAMASIGRTADGDGSCFAAEKYVHRPVCPRCQEWEAATRSKKDDGPSFFCWRKKGGCGHEWTPTAEDWIVDRSQATIHNVRAHAHTRAFNRAVSNLVGFGEVSAEEITQQTRDSRGTQTSEGRDGSSARSGDARAISDAQRKRLWALAMSAGEEMGAQKEVVEQVLREELHALGVDSSKDIPRSKYEQVCERVEARIRGEEVSGGSS